MVRCLLRFIIALTYVGDVIYVASLEDSEIETYCNKITKMIDDFNFIHRLPIY